MFLYNSPVLGCSTRDLVSLGSSKQRLVAELGLEAWLLQTGAGRLTVRVLALCADALQADCQRQQSLRGQTREQEEM